MKRLCQICNDPLHGKQRKYCSECKHKVHKQQMEVYYKNNKSEWLDKDGKYVSDDQKCLGRVSGKDHWGYGKHLSDKHKQAISDANKGQNHGMYDHKHTQEQKDKWSKDRKGKKHWNWNPNLTNENRLNKRLYSKYKEWRTLVFKRDNFTCQICGLGGKLNAHHLESYANNPELRTTLENGITLCEDCHKDFHHIYGYDCTHEQFIEFIKYSMNQNNYLMGDI